VVSRTVSYYALMYPLYAGASLRAGGFSVDKQFGLRVMVVDRTIEAPTGLSNVVQMFETALVQCARHTLEARPHTWY